VVRAAVVVVELDRHEVKVNGLQQCIVGEVWVRALRRNRQEIGLVPFLGRHVHVAAQLRREGHHVLDLGLEIEIEPVDDGLAEGTEDGALCNRAKHGPDYVCPFFGLGGRDKAALIVGRAADGEEDGFA